LHRFLIIISFVFCSNFIVAQSERIVVKGKVSENLKPIENAHITVRENFIVQSQKDGSFEFRVWRGTNYKLTISHISYETQYYQLKTDGNSPDTLVLNFSLQQKAYLLDTGFVVNPKDYAPDTVFRSPRISISDYEFYEDKMVFLAYERRLNKGSELLLVDHKENVLTKVKVDAEAVELYRDYAGYINLVCKNAVYRVVIEGEDMYMAKIPLDQFQSLVKPCLDTLPGRILFSDIYRNLPRLKYFMYNVSDTSVTTIKEVIDEDQDWQYHFEYYNLTNAEKAYAMRLARRMPGFDKYDVAAAMTGFSSDFLYEKMYAPMFIKDDTLCLFNFYEKKLQKFVDDTVLVNEAAIDFHHTSGGEKWKQQMLMDEITQKIYAVFLKDGYYKLKEISWATGEVVNEFKLFNKYAEEIKVMEGETYYVFRPYESISKKFLYKERLPY